MPTTSRLDPRALRRALVWGIAAIFVLRFGYFLFLDLADGRTGHVPERLFNEATGALLGAIPLGALFWLARRVPLVRPLPPHATAIYAAGFVALSIVHTTAMIVVRAALGPALGLHDGYDLTFRAARYAYEGATDVVFFGAALALLALAESVLAQRERERHAAELERSLLRAELGTLRLQLQPHFLFNALNTISSTMYEDVATADALLTRLAELLRTSLRTTHTQEVPARDELATLGQYLELMRARFGDRLHVTIDAPDDTLDVRVPSMLLQPLVENAVRHGGVTTSGRGCVHVGLRRADAWLEILVRDQTFGSAQHAARAAHAEGSDGGTGLSSTQRRLQLLYGDAQSMTAWPVPNGWEVRIRIPVRA